MSVGVVISSPVRNSFAQQAGGPEDEHDAKNDEGEDVLVAGVEEAKAHVLDVAGADGLHQSSSSPPSMAPPRLPMPPSTAAVKALSPGMKPIA